MLKASKCGTIELCKVTKKTRSGTYYRLPFEGKEFYVSNKNQDIVFVNNMEDAVKFVKENK